MKVKAKHCVSKACRWKSRLDNQQCLPSLRLTRSPVPASLDVVACCESAVRVAKPSRPLLKRRTFLGHVVVPIVVPRLDAA